MLYKPDNEKKKPVSEIPGIADIIRLYGKDIRMTIRKYASRYRDILDELHSDDIEQLVYEKILNGCLNTYEGRASLKNYLCYSVVKSVFYSYLRANLKQLKEPTDNIVEMSDHLQTMNRPYDPVTTASDTESLQILIEKTISSMPPNKQSIYRMIVEENITQTEISRKLGITQSTVSEHWSKIRVELKDRIRKEFPGLFFGENRGDRNGQKAY